MMRLCLALSLCVALAGCAGPTGYRAAVDGGVGYSERMIEPGRWRVAYRGGSATERDAVEKWLLRRAAEVTLAAGGGHFVVVTRDVDLRETRRGGYLVGAPWGGWSSARGPWAGVSVAAPVTVERFEASAEILVREGPKRTDDPGAYDARAVLAALGVEAARNASGDGRGGR
jgi:hypothetical protein